MDGSVSLFQEVKRQSPEDGKWLRSGLSPPFLLMFVFGEKCVSI